jgi:hypothetical protein
MNKHRPMKLKAHHNVADLAEERRLREERRAADMSGKAVRFHTLGGIVFVGYRSAEPQHITPRHRRLSEAALDDIARKIGRGKRQGWRWRLRRLLAVLGFARRSRPS